MSRSYIPYFGDSQDHDNSPWALFVHVREKDLTLSADKGEYNKNSLEFLGHVFGEDGIKPRETKLKTILNNSNECIRSEKSSGHGELLWCSLHPQLCRADSWIETPHKEDNTVVMDWKTWCSSSHSESRTGQSDNSCFSLIRDWKATEIYTDSVSPQCRHLCGSDSRWSRNSVCEPSSHSNRTTLLRDGTWSTCHHMGVSVLPHLHLQLFIFCLHWPQAPGHDVEQSSRSPLCTNWMLDDENAAQHSDCSVASWLRQPSWLLSQSRHPVQQSSNSREEKIADEYLHYIVNTSTPKSMRLDTVNEKLWKIVP